jgi:hypothetical protein
MSQTVSQLIERQITYQANEAIAHFVFAHGAGADMHHEFMQTISQYLVKQGISVTLFNFPYMVKRQVDMKRYPPDRMPKLIESYQQVLDKISTELPIFIGGKSMGGRVAATVLTTEEVLSKKVTGLICLGYPFHPIKQVEKLRLTPLQRVQLPTLVIQGERDSLGNKTEITGYDLSPYCHVEFLADGDHSFKPRVKSGYRYEQHLQLATQLMVSFIKDNSK